MEKDRDNIFNDYKLRNSDNNTVNRIPVSGNEGSNKKYVVDTLDENLFPGFNETLENYLKVSVGHDVYNLIKYNKQEVLDTTIFKYLNHVGYTLQGWNIVCNDKNGNGKKTISSNHQKQALQFLIKELQIYLRSVTVFCLSRKC